MPKLIASSLSKDDFESMKVGGSVPVAPESSETASIPVTVEWRNITLNAETAAGPKAILRGLTGHASPGELVAIMGPSGAGKTSLLNALAQRNANFGGEVLLNGEPWREAFFSVLAYMPQDEMFLSELTPREHLSYMAQLRLHQKSPEVQAARVEQVIGEMKLGGVADLLIGDPNNESGLSRNERKRLNFATETLMEPSLLYVDEPTTGLDSVMATNVVQQLKAMASGSSNNQNTGNLKQQQSRQLRTVLCTIHQPSSEIYKLFDKLYFVVDGRAAFFGNTADVPAYFTRMGYPMAARINPSDFVMELVVDPSNRAAASARRLTICDQFSTSEKVAPPNAKSRAALVAVGGVAAASLSQQFQVLLAREVTMRRRMPILVQAILMRNVVLGLLLGLVMLRLDMAQTYVYTITGSVFFGVASMVMPTAIGHISTIPLQLPCVIREIRSNGYSALPFFAVKFVADVPVDVLGVFVFAILLNFMTGMANDSGVVFVKITVIFFSATLIGNAIGQWASILAPASTPFVGLIVLLVVIIPQFLFCGVLILLDMIPVWWQWMSDLSVFRYFLELTLAAMWQSYGDIPCDYLEVKGEPVEICPFPNGQAVLDFYSMGRSPWVCILAIFAWWLFFKLLGYRVLVKKCTPPSSAFGSGSNSGPPPDDATAETMPSSDQPNALLNNDNNTTSGDVETGRQGQRNASVSPLSVSWRDFGFAVEVSDANNKAPKTSKTILQGLHGSAKAGELVAVMGGSGSGKSTFLRGVGQRQSEGSVTGAISFNGSSFDSSVHGRGIAFMGQEDDFIAEVTVHEHLLFHASLRMASHVTPAQRAARVEEVMSGLGLVKVKDTLIGAIGSGISGGERRRLSYAAELLQHPSLLLLDEPTSGLDSSMAEMVVQTLRAAADRGTTVMCTIHQPSAKVFSFFDKLLLLSAGETAYFGPRADALPFFEQLGFPCPADGDTVEHLMSLVDATPLAKKQLADGAAIPQDSKSSRDQAVAATRKASQALPAPRVTNPSTTSPASNDAGLTSSSFKNNWWAQLIALWGREMTVRKRSKILTKAVFGRTFFVSFLLSTLYWQVAKDQQGVFSITGALSFIVLNHVFTYVIGQAVNMPAVVPTLKREHHANMYSIESWYLSKTLADLPFDLTTTFVLATVCYWTIGFTDSGANYGYFLLMLALVALLATGFGHLVGVVASVLNKPELAVPLAMLVLFPMFLFAGLLVNFNNCPSYLLWLQYISVFYYSFCLVSVNQWKDYGAIECSAEDLARTGIGRCAFMSGDDILAYFGINPDDETRNIIIVLCMIVFCRVSCIFLLSMKLSKRS